MSGLDIGIKAKTKPTRPPTIPREPLIFESAPKTLGKVAVASRIVWNP